MPMKLDVRQPDCLLLAVYERAGKLVAVGKVRRLDGKMLTEPVLVEAGTEPFALLRDALEQAVDLKVKHCAVFTNSPDLAAFFTPPIKIEQPDRQTVRMGRNETVEVPAGGDPNQWRTLHLLLGYRKFRVWAISPDRMNIFAPGRRIRAAASAGGYTGVSGIQEYRHHRPRRPRQDHAGGRHALAERHLPRQ